ncbi:hypothetical protein GBAR_LOCUS10678 [Geodia barretti]|uniref:Uncharacterized protein n=1 Tax=Geodia barretti TaxID=519541 RepID=A0AA35RTV5_GEOBA|nr:hypothetical protein GBAR_LOCUS10678 [Geodia barretti]
MAQPQPYPGQQPPVTSVPGPGKNGKTSYLPPDVLRPHHQQQHAAHNHYIKDPTHGQVRDDAPPPLPPKPGPKPLQRPAAVGTQFSHQGPPRGNPLNTHSSGGIPPQHQQPPFPSRHRFDPPPHGAAASVVGNDEPQYVHMMSKEEQELVRQRARASDAESNIRERELELSQCHTEIAKTRQCVRDKKEEVKAKEQEITQLRAELDRLRQAAIGRAQPLVAGNEAALQAEVQQYRRVVQDLRGEMEQLRGRQNVATPPPSTDMQELIRLRGEVYIYVHWNL